MSEIYQIWVYTGNIKGAGTDADVKIVIAGETATTKEIRLDNPGDDFEQGDTDQFRITTDRNLGSLKYIVMSHNNKGAGADWYLEGVKIRCLGTGEVTYFPANRWLSKGSGTRATLYPEQKELNFRYINCHPNDRENGWSNELNGVCHDDNNWFFTQDGNLWKFPVSHDLNTLCKTADPSKGILKAAMYTHLGDIDYFQNYVFVPRSNAETKSYRILVFNANDLSVQTSQEMHKPDGTAFTDIGWCAINRGFLFTSSGGLRRDNPIFVYRINLEAINKRSGQFLTYHASFNTMDENGSPLERGYMQGGCFDNQNHLYLTNGSSTNPLSSDKNYANYKGGISVFRVPDVIENRAGQVLRRITASNQKDGFKFNFSGIGEEPEGITYWDLDNGRAPRISGQLHAIMIDNAGSFDDDFFFNHYREV